MICLRKRVPILAASAVLGLLLGAPPTRGAVACLDATKDNTIYSDVVTYSNAAGPGIYAGNPARFIRPHS